MGLQLNTKCRLVLCSEQNLDISCLTGPRLEAIICKQREHPRKNESKLDFSHIGRAKFHILIYIFALYSECRKGDRGKDDSHRQSRREKASR